MEGGGYLGSWCLPDAPLGAGLTHGNDNVFVERIRDATRFGKVTAAAIALDTILLRARLGWFVTVRQLVIGKGRVRRAIRKVVCVREKILACVVGW